MDKNTIIDVLRVFSGKKPKSIRVVSQVQAYKEYVEYKRAKEIIYNEPNPVVRRQMIEHLEDGDLDYIDAHRTNFNVNCYYDDDYDDDEELDDDD